MNETYCRPTILPTFTNLSNTLLRADEGIYVSLTRPTHRSLPRSFNQQNKPSARAVSTVNAAYGRMITGWLDDMSARACSKVLNPDYLGIFSNNSIK
jgi:hypothetical protein